MATDIRRHDHRKCLCAFYDENKLELLIYAARKASLYSAKELSLVADYLLV